MIIKRLYDELLDDAVTRLATNTAFTGVTTKGSPSRAILEVVLGKVAELYADVEGNTAAMFVNSAVGPELDLLAALVGITRRLNETDQDLRFRIVKSNQTAAKCNRESIKSDLLNLDGVRDVQFKDWLLGIGSYGVYIIPTTQYGPTTLSDAQDIVDANEAEGIRGIVLAPTLLPVDLSLKVSVADTSIDVTSAVQNSEALYLDNLNMGETMVFSKLIQTAMDANQAISDVQVNIIRINDKEVLHRNYKPQFDEQLKPRTITVTR